MSIRSRHTVEELVIDEQVIEIRKYSNRRLYDTSASQYVKLVDVEQMIREGKEIKVVDAQSGEDLTRSVMLQIICESKTQQELLPVSFLRQIIQASGKTVRSSIKEFLSMGLQAQKDLQQQLSSVVKASVNMNPFMSAFVHMFQNAAQQQSKTPQAAPPPVMPRAEAETDKVPREKEELVVEKLHESQRSHDNSKGSASNGKSSNGTVKDELAALREQIALIQNQIDRMGDKQDG